MLHEMFLHGGETFIDALADGNGRNDDNKLAPAVTLVQFKYRLDVDIGFSGSGFHFHVQRADAQICCHGRGAFDIVIVLNLMNVFENIHGRVYLRVFESYRQFIFGRLPVFKGTAYFHVAPISKALILRLSLENFDHAFHGFRLVGLDGKFEFHIG